MRFGQLICPTSALAEFPSTHTFKNNSVFRNQKLLYVLGRPAPMRGAYRDRHERGAGCDGRGGAD